MIRAAHLKADWKQIRQEPMMLLFAFLSIVLIVVFRLILNIVPPLLMEWLDFDLLVYKSYIISMVYMLHPMMVAMVIGFFMLDEKDAKIFELLRVTPLGFSGYMINRLIVPGILVVIYGIITYIVLGHEVHSFLVLIPIIIFMILEMIGIGMFIPMVSEDKVKGLTNTKAISGFLVFGFFDLLPIAWLQIVAKCVPFYYVTKVTTDFSFLWVLVGLIVHMIWLVIVYKFSVRKL